ncbi:helix-turn-helix transcriptional regulator [Pseudogracilibacillus sp. ICA-222130]|uniref:helix-turn-helix transcriptional regulator n=1 Tax=Pseudogracilibacillus sp. ICA-222130 TaxID=3134655 RepID=UPI0030C4056E
MGREETLDLLKRVADGIAMMFGSNCETVIHDMEKETSSIVYITNGHVTEREVGDSLTILGKKELADVYKGVDLVNKKGIAKNNHFIKGSTFHAKGDGYHFALGINYDYTNMLMVHNIVSELINVGDSMDIAAVSSDENLEHKLEELFSEAMEYIGKPVAFMRKNDRVEMIKYLNEKGAFSIHKGIPTIAEKMNISRYTIYNYLREIKE